jgi:hypothetical protein
MDDERAQSGLGGGRPRGPRRKKPWGPSRPRLAMIGAFLAGAAVVALAAWAMW